MSDFSEASIDAMGKDELSRYAIENFGVTLTVRQMRTSIDNVRKIVADLEAARADADLDGAPETPEEVNMSVDSTPEVSDEVELQVETESSAPAEPQDPPQDDDPADDTIDDTQRYVKNPTTGAVFFADGDMAQSNKDWPQCNKDGEVSA